MQQSQKIQYPCAAQEDEQSNHLLANSSGSLSHFLHTGGLRVITGRQVAYLTSVLAPCIFLVPKTIKIVDATLNELLDDLGYVGGPVMQFNDQIPGYTDDAGPLKEP